MRFFAKNYKFSLLCVAEFGKTLDPYGTFYMINKLYHRANPYSSFKPIARFVVEIQHFVCDRTTPPTIEKLWSKGAAVHMYDVSAYTTREPEINSIVRGGAVRNEHKDRARVEFSHP